MRSESPQRDPAVEFKAQWINIQTYERAGRGMQGMDVAHCPPPPRVACTPQAGSGGDCGSAPSSSAHGGVPGATGGRWQWCGGADPQVEGQGSALRPLFRFKWVPGGFVRGQAPPRATRKGWGSRGGFNPGCREEEEDRRDPPCHVPLTPGTHWVPPWALVGTRCPRLQCPHRAQGLRAG